MRFVEANFKTIRPTTCPAEQRNANCITCRYKVAVALVDEDGKPCVLCRQDQEKKKEKEEIKE